MRCIYTFDPSHNPGRAAGWSVREEVKRLADQGASGLAGLILRDGFSPFPTDAIAYVPNDSHETMAALCAEIIAGLGERTNENGSVKPAFGVQVAVIKSSLDTIADRIADGIVVDGRRRMLATILAWAVGRQDVEPVGVELTEEQAAQTEAAFRINVNRELAQRLDPWAKVEAGERVLAEKPSTSETDLMSALGVKRGDGQLIHRAASAIRKHKLTPDRSKRCPGKEEWKTILDQERADVAAAELAKLQSQTRDKALGVDQVAKALSVLPEGTTGDLRKLGEALASREALDAYLKALDIA